MRFDGFYFEASLGHLLKFYSNNVVLGEYVQPGSLVYCEGGKQFGTKEGKAFVKNLNVNNARWIGRYSANGIYIVCQLRNYNGHTEQISLNVTGSALVGSIESSYPQNYNGRVFDFISY